MRKADQFKSISIKSSSEFDPYEHKTNGQLSNRPVNISFSSIFTVIFEEEEEKRKLLQANRLINPKSNLHQGEA